jgi:SPP1 family holin
MKIIEKLKTIDKGTIIRTVTLILALCNQFVAVIGASTFANAVWYQVFSLAVTIASALFSAWKNNDFTKFAQLGSGVLHALKDGKITEDEVKELLNK